MTAFKCLVNSVLFDEACKFLIKLFDISGSIEYNLDSTVMYCTKTLQLKFRENRGSHSPKIGACLFGVPTSVM